MKQKNTCLCIIGAFGMLLMILDAEHSIKGAFDGIEICVKTVIPSLFPLFFFSGLLQAGLSKQEISFLRPIGRICGIPKGAEYLLLIGLTGGYPLGAKNIENAFRCGNLQREDAERMLGFCNNAGPAFIFGMAGTLFSDWYVGWIIWIIQILSSLVCGIVLSNRNNKICSCSRISTISIPQILKSSIKSMATVCGWIILFRVFIFLLNRWILWIFPLNVSVLITGIIELSNGCIAMTQIQNPAFRFIAISALMAIGGMCIAIQTISVAGNLHCKLYFIGKLFQLFVVLPLTTICSIFLFPGNISTINMISFVVIPSSILIILASILKNKAGNYALNSV